MLGSVKQQGNSEAGNLVDCTSELSADDLRALFRRLDWCVLPHDTAGNISIGLRLLVQINPARSCETLLSTDSNISA